MIQGGFHMRAVITVVGKDMMGIIAKVSAELLKYGVNILDISQTVMGGLFAMIMLGDISGSTATLPELAAALNELARQNGLKIHVMHEDIFESMHRI